MASAEHRIRRLVETDTEAYVALRLEMLAATPWAFLASADNDRGADPVEQRARFAAAEAWHATFGAFSSALELVGAVGVIRPPQHPKAAHKAHIWGMYVRESHRGKGLGKGLLAAAVAHARTIDGVDYAQLGVSSAAPAARRLYESAGFQAWGVEPAALRYDGASYDEVHMALRLR